MARLWLLLVVACGSVDHVNDAGSDDARRTGTVTVQVWIDDSLNALADPSVGTDVVFAHADGTIYDVVQTDAAGQATHDVTTGDMVTAFAQDVSGNPRLFTVLDVAPGDVLVMDLPGYAPWLQIGTIHVTMPPPATGAVSYGYNDGCIAGSTVAGANVDVMVTAACASGPQTASVVISARDGATPPHLVAYNYAKDVSIAGGSGTAAFTGWRTDVGTLTVDLANAPADTTLLFVDFRPFAGQTGFLSDNLQTAAAPGSTTQLVFDRASGVYDAAVLQLGAVFAPGRSASQIRGLTSLPPQVTVELGDLLPEITDAATTQSGVTWTAAGSLARADAGIVTARYANSGAAVAWTFYFPPSYASIDFPELPSDLAPYAPSAASVPATPDVYFISDSTIADWDAARNSLYGEDITAHPGDYIVDWTYSLKVGGKRVGPHRFGRP